MAKITNLLGKRSILLPLGHIISKTGLDTITNESIRCPDNWPSINPLILSGEISIEWDEEPAILADEAPPPEVEVVAEAPALAPIFDPAPNEEPELPMGEPAPVETPFGSRRK